MDIKIIFVIVFSLVVVIFGVFVDWNKKPAPKPDPVARDSTRGQDLAASDTICFVENCHGLSIQCGSNPAGVCSDVYELGDRCLRYAKCGIADGACRQLPSTQFDTCKSCVLSCVASFKNSQTEMLDCESRCSWDENPGLTEEIAARRRAIEMLQLEFYDFENQNSFAGRSVKNAIKGNDYYFAYIEHGSGVPIAKATCFKVDAAYKSAKIGEFPNETTPAGIYTGIDPLTCNGIK